MPIYEFSCDNCGVKFEELMPLGSNGDGLSCPSCGKTDIHKLMSAFGFGGSAISKPSSSASCSSCSAGSCDHCH